MTLKVLLVNKFFFPNAGAETAFFSTRSLLQERGHQVFDFAMEDPRNLDSPFAKYFAKRRTYDEGTPISRARDAFSTVYSWDARRALRKLISDHPPDVAHLHNIYHQLSLSILDELWENDVPTVLTVHDYKPICPSYDLFTEGRPCRRCICGSPSNAVRYRCVKGSRAASAIAAAEAILARRRNSYGRVDVLIAPSRFLRERLIEGGLTASRIRVLPNFVSPSWPSLQSECSTMPPTFIFAGRLDQQKGVRTLLEACRSLTGESLRVAFHGRGPLADDVRRARAPAVHMGFTDSDRLEVALSEARALVVPSIWEENCPMVVLEARAQGIPVIGTAHGGLPELISHEVDGLLVPPGDPEALASALRRLATHPAEARRLGENGRRRAGELHGPDSHLKGLLDCYGSAISARTPSSSASGST